MMKLNQKERIERHQENPIIQRLNNTILNNTWAKEEKPRKIKIGKEMKMHTERNQM